MRVLFLIDAAIRPVSPPHDLVQTISPPIIEQPLMSGIYFLLYVTGYQLDLIDYCGGNLPERHIALLPTLFRPQLRRLARLWLWMITCERRG